MGDHLTCSRAVQIEHKDKRKILFFPDDTHEEAPSVGRSVIREIEPTNRCNTRETVHSLPGSGYLFFDFQGHHSDVFDLDLSEFAFEPGDGSAELW
jgi:hypothetical protein